MSFIEVNYFVHLTQESPTTSSSRDILFHALSISLDKGRPGQQYWRNDSLDSCLVEEENCTSHMTYQRVDTTRSSVNKFEQINEANFLCRNECVTTQSVTDFWTPLRCTDHQFHQQCEVECEIPIRLNLLRLHSRFSHLYVFSHRFRRNSCGSHGATIKRKKWIIRWQEEPVTAWNTQARCAAVRCVQPLIANQ